MVDINNYQKSRFSKKIIDSLFKTVNDKNISIFGWAFKKNTNDSRESAAIYICDQLIEEGANVNIYDPKILKNKIESDLINLWESKEFSIEKINSKLKKVKVFENAIDCTNNSHAIAIVTEWEEFKNIDYKKVFENMFKPAFVFDGRKIMNGNKLINIGFNYFEIGKSKR